MPTTESVSQAESAAPADAVLSPPASRSRFLEAGERLAQHFIRFRHGSELICTYCHRGEVNGAIPHTPECDPGILLAEGARLRSIAQSRPGVESQIKQMADRFLGWKLPENFNPDGGISFRLPAHPNHPWPTGTNLLDATQAAAMVHCMLAEPGAEGCEYCGPVCYGGAAHTARMEDGKRTVVYTCNRAIAVCGENKGYDVLTCGLDVNHGDIWHEDKAAGIKWPTDAVSIRVLPSGRLKVLRFDNAEAIFLDQMLPAAEVAR